ncbi:EAL domain-containing protein [Aurantimonas litoralis]|nr:EAL domain-containing protein [Aurantimonas litoralis]
MMSQPTERNVIAPSMLRFTTMLALVVSVLVAVVPPALHFYYGLHYAEGSLAAEARLNSRLVSQIVGRNPQMWQFETLRIDEMIAFTDATMTKTLLNAEGGEVTRMGAAALPWPTVTTAHPVYDSGAVAGRILITQSLFALAKTSALLFLVCAAGALGVFFALRTLPLRLLRRAADRASFLASHDPLTQLPNRSLFNEWLVRSVADVDRQDGSMAVLCLDLDHFKEVNDLLGHAAGDELLRQVTERMTATLRRNDVLARLGGDEFAIIQKHFAQPAGSARLAERLIEELSKPFDLLGNEVMIGVSVGVALRRDPEDRDGQDLLRQADMAMYRAKNDGRGTFRYFEEAMNDRLVARKTLELALRHAIARNELHLHYQPQIDMKTNSVKGVEALIRWYRGEDGIVQPNDFIQLAEETGLIIPIGEWVIREACRQAGDWPELTFAVNVSPVQFRHGNLVETVRSALAEAGVEPHRLEIEITESVLLTHTDETIETLRALQAMGVRIAMDDFGTGYSSLSYLRRFPFDKIKIDRSFTSDLGTCFDADSIVAAVINLGAAMGMVSNAEGVETLEQAELLRAQGCNEVQGFLYSRPVPSASIAQLLADWKTKVAELQSAAPETVVQPFARCAPELTQAS